MMRFVLKVGLFLVLLAVFLEVFFRLVVPAASRPTTVQNQVYGIMQYDRTGPTQGLYTAGRQAQHRAHWRVNNMGWISAEDYTGRQEKCRPRAVVIGNSYVEAIYLDVDKHLAPVTRKELGRDVDFYSLGAWGVDLGQGVKVTDYAREVLGPDLVILVVSHGALRRSVRNLANRPFCLQVEFRDDDALAIEPRVFRPSRLRGLVQFSATLGYLRGNAHVTLGGGAQVESAFAKKTLDVENMTPAQAREQTLMSKGAEWIVSRLAEQNPGTEFLFLVDADRNIIQTGTKPLPIPAAGCLVAAVRGRDAFHVLDLTEALWADYEAEGLPLSDDGNYHWNAHAVQVIGAALAQYISQNELLSSFDRSQ